MRWVIGLAFGFPVVVLACGARTGLYVPYHRDAQPPHEAGRDVVEEDVVEEEFPPLDAAKHDADKTGCPPLTYIWAVSRDDSLVRFDPPTATFTRVAKIVCPAFNSHPFSMAVDRKSIAWVEYDNGQIFAVNTADGSCQSTQYAANQMMPFGNFGMGFVTLGTGPAEQLFIAADSPGTLGRIDMPTLEVLSVGTFEPQLSWAELTGTGAGQLYAYWAVGYNTGSYVSEIDKTTGNVIGQDYMPQVDRGMDWAFAYWGGDFYIFTYPGPQNTWHYDPATKTATIVAHFSEPIVGAGVSTCAPD